jgi:uncharacterized MAPEG superfamily protein
MSTSLALPALITALSVFLQAGMMMMVGNARQKYNIQAPATTGHPGFERAFRVQMNTLENTMMFLPALWVFAVFLNAEWSAVIGAVWLLARVWYAISYQRDPATRGKAFILSLGSIGLLAFGGLCGALRVML